MIAKCTLNFDADEKAYLRTLEVVPEIDAENNTFDCDIDSLIERLISLSIEIENVVFVLKTLTLDNFNYFSNYKYFFMNGKYKVILGHVIYKGEEEAFNQLTKMKCQHEEISFYSKDGDELTMICDFCDQLKRYKTNEIILEDDVV